MIADDPCDPTPCGSYTNPPKLLEIDVIARVVHPCNPSSCGMNAECFENRGAASCSCILDYVGNPYVECKPECTVNPECPRDKACINNKCGDPCPGVCGAHATCSVISLVLFV